MAARYRWVAPDGRKGRWRSSLAGAVISAVGTEASSRSVTVRVCARVAAALWPGLVEKGWRLEQQNLGNGAGV